MVELTEQQGLFYHDSDLSHNELRLLLAGSVSANGWDAPGMDEYNNYDEHKK